MLITGPNGSGKSTVMRAVIANVLLVQSFGIAAATSATVTPFDKINAYLNEQEDLQKGLSTFMAEALKLRDICRFIAHVPAGSRSLTLIDEGLRGTVSVEAGKRLSAALAQAATNKQSICIVATHLPEPIQLEEQTHGAIRNYCVVIDEVSPGVFVRTFKLERGASLWWFDDAEKRKRFVDWLIQLADASVAGAVVVHA
jgi:DNA mismatch repair protein MutS